MAATVSQLVVMMAKAPVPGRVKTRLGLPGDRAARLARAFIDDTWRALARVSGVDRALAYAGDAGDLPPSVAGARRWAQCAGDLGARIEDVLRRGLASADRVIAVGSDAPGLPPALLARAFAALADHDAVIGPACDGGYVLLGATRCEPGLLADLPWSQPDTGRATRARLGGRGYRTAVLPTWFDVDDAGDLARLRAAIAAGWISAPASREVIG